MIKLIVADDHTMFLEGIKKIIDEPGSGIQVVGKASNASELLTLLTKHKPDIISLDLSMPGKNGMEVLKDIKANYPKIPVLILSMYPEERFAVRALKAGAHGYLNKSAVPDELVRAVKKVVNQKKKYISSQVAEVLVEDFHTYKEKPLHEYLSDREEQIMLMIAEDKKTSEIAKELHISIHTVHTYRSRIIKKLGVTSNIGITHYVIDNHLVE